MGFTETLQVVSDTEIYVLPPSLHHLGNAALEVDAEGNLWATKTASLDLWVEEVPPQPDVWMVWFTLPHSFDAPQPWFGDFSVTQKVVLERSLDGYVWRVVDDSLTEIVELVDYGGRSKGVTFYRATAVSPLGALATSFFESESDSLAVWVSSASMGQINFALRHNLTVNTTLDKPMSEVIFFDNPGQPPHIVEGIPADVSHRVSVVGNMLPLEVKCLGSDTAEVIDILEGLFRRESHTVLRTPSGLVLEGSLQFPQFETFNSGHALAVSFQFVEAQ